ncbi:MAG: prolyl aminopeptidase [bacterium]|nr:prolyl aminopeptidase [bacterium]
MNVRELYPKIEPYRHFMLPVSDLHNIYVEECGNPQGRPVVFLHGGPGGGVTPNYRRFFDPRKWRIILFDQRGCGRSKPFATLEENTTWHLVSDIEAIRTHLDIESWAVFGGSWGSTLALAYAETHPERVRSLTLRGIFMLRRREIDWFYQDGASRIFPDAWRHYLEAIPPEEHGDLVRAYHKRLTSEDAETRLAAARAWSIWEGSTSKLYPDAAFAAGFGSEHFALAFARIECHYFINGGFMESDDQLIQNVDRVRKIPAVIVHGRYDVVCPLGNAYDLCARWPEADLQIIPDAGHSAMEPGTRTALLNATDRFAEEG